MLRPSWPREGDRYPSSDLHARWSELIQPRGRMNTLVPYGAPDKTSQKIWYFFLVKLCKILLGQRFSKAERRDRRMTWWCGGASELSRMKFSELGRAGRPSYFVGSRPKWVLDGHANTYGHYLVANGGLSRCLSDWVLKLNLFAERWLW